MKTPQAKGRLGPDPMSRTPSRGQPSPVRVPQRWAGPGPPGRRPSRHHAAPDWHLRTAASGQTPRPLLRLSLFDPVSTPDPAALACHCEPVTPLWAQSRSSGGRNRPIKGGEMWSSRAQRVCRAETLCSGPAELQKWSRRLTINGNLVYMITTISQVSGSRWS